MPSLPSGSYIYSASGEEHFVARDNKPSVEPSDDKEKLMDPERPIDDKYDTELLDEFREHLPFAAAACTADESIWGKTRWKTQMHATAAVRNSYVRKMVLVAGFVCIRIGMKVTPVIDPPSACCFPNFWDVWALTKTPKSNECAEEVVGGLAGGG